MKQNKTNFIKNENWLFFGFLVVEFKSKNAEETLTPFTISDFGFCNESSFSPVGPVLIFVLLYSVFGETLFPVPGPISVPFGFAGVVALGFLAATAIAPDRIFLSSSFLLVDLSIPFFYLCLLLFTSVTISLHS